MRPNDYIDVFVRIESTDVRHPPAPGWNARTPRRGSLTRPLVLQAIAQAGGNKTVAAAQLGVSRKTIHEYVRMMTPA